MLSSEQKAQVCIFYSFSLEINKIPILSGRKGTIICVTTADNIKNYTPYKQQRGVFNAPLLFMFTLKQFIKIGGVTPSISKLPNLRIITSITLLLYAPLRYAM